MARLHHVSAVVVAHNGAVWLPTVTSFLAEQTRLPDSVVGVDTGSTDGSAVILSDALGAARVIRVSADTAFGAAVQAGIASLPRQLNEDVIEWLWILHDDSAPDSACLERLLRDSDLHATTAVFGAKALGWHDRRLLLEVGFSVMGSGRRVTGLERREHDQGQHDDRSDTLAVGSAGMLVRRDVWDALGGFDPALPLFRDDLDFCWRVHRAGHAVRVVPAAVIYHREASFHGRRSTGSRREGGGGPVRRSRMHRADRRSALHVLLAQTPGWRLPFTFVRLVLGTLFRSLLYVLGKDLGRASDELRALGGVITHLGQLNASRRRNRGLASSSCARWLRPRARTRLRHAIEAVGGMLASGSRATSEVDEDDFPDDSQPGVVRRTFMRPSVWTALVLLVIAAAASRSLWWGSGSLFGGALLPAPEGAGDLWATYTQGWHSLGPGSTTPAPPSLALLALFSSVLLGKAPLAIDLIFLLAVPAAGFSAFLSSRGVVTSTPVRVWLSVTYALLPAVTTALGTGRIGTLAAAVLLPPTVRLLARCAGVGTTGTALRPATNRTPWFTAVVLSVLVAFAPVLWVVAFVFAIVAAAIGRQVRNLLIAVLAPLFLLLPWSFEVALNPSLLLSEPGVPVLDGLPVTPLRAALLQPGGPAQLPWWLFAGLVLAALLALLRHDKVRITLALWGVALVSLVIAVIQTRVYVTLPAIQAPVPTWPGPATLLLGFALVCAAAVAGDGLRERIGGATFGWRQPGALVLTTLAVLTPFAAVGWWFAQPLGPLHRGDPALLPAYVAEESRGPSQTRTLAIKRGSGGVMTYTVLSGGGLVVGDAETAPPAAAWMGMDAAVSALTSGRGGDEVRALAAQGVGYVLVTDARDGDPLIATLDSEPGMRRLSRAPTGALWSIAGTTSLTRVLSPDGSSEPVLNGVVPPGAAGRVLVLTQAPDPGWEAAVGDVILPVTTAPEESLMSWAQAFSLGPEGATVDIRFDDAQRQRWLWLELFLVVIVIVLSLPTRTSRDPDADDPDQDDFAQSGVGA